LFFKVTAPTEIYTLSLHDALPISAAGDGRHGTTHGFVSRRNQRQARRSVAEEPDGFRSRPGGIHDDELVSRRSCHSIGCEQWDSDRKSTRLNSSHVSISYAVFCLK